MPDQDGLLSVIVSGLDVRTTYVVAASAYDAVDGESELSNEVSIGYADVAPFVDSDGDGLTDAAEDVNLNQTVDPGETDPENDDTDEDGILDGDDRCQGTSAGIAVDELGCQSCATLMVRKVGFQTRRRHQRFFGRAVIAPVPEIDPATSGVVLELIDAAGTSLYKGELPGVAFTRKRARRIFSFRGRSSQVLSGANGLRKVVFKRKGMRMVVLVEADTPELSDASPLTWLIRSGEICMKVRGLTCGTTSRRMTRCR